MEVNMTKVFWIVVSILLMIWMSASYFWWITNYKM